MKNIDLRHHRKKLIDLFYIFLSNPLSMETTLLRKCSKIFLLVTLAIFGVFGVSVYGTEFTPEQLASFASDLVTDEPTIAILKEEPSADITKDLKNKLDALKNIQSKNANGIDAMFRGMISGDKKNKAKETHDKAVKLSEIVLADIKVLQDNLAKTPTNEFKADLNTKIQKLMKDRAEFKAAYTSLLNMLKENK